MHAFGVDDIYPCTTANRVLGAGNSNQAKHGKFCRAPANPHPDHDTIAASRKRHLEALAGLYVQALLLYQKAGWVKLGHVAIDGTKIEANASKYKAMSYWRKSGATVGARLNSL